ncbi:DUF6586 family protein [Marinobacter changyiensis]|uniref:DUF6586 family protein n=1 Tax=Marinobacter changyiensis TaxID=2604091 RepID=UPI0012650158|nr:DUF6586 family protein [Marinobacter changyiensis]
MSSEWYTLTSQKLFLAETLIKISQQAPDRGTVEATLQGAIELSLRARKCLLLMIARYYQHKSAQPESLDELKALIGTDAPESVQLLAIAKKPGSWWDYLDQMELSQGKPPGKKKTISEDNIIAVAIDTGPDRSAALLADSIAAMRQYLTILAERHEEW